MTKVVVVLDAILLGLLVGVQPCQDVSSGLVHHEPLNVPVLLLLLPLSLGEGLLLLLLCTAPVDGKGADWTEQPIIKFHMGNLLDNLDLSENQFLHMQPLYHNSL